MNDRFRGMSGVRYVVWHEKSRYPVRDGAGGTLYYNTAAEAVAEAERLAEDGMTYVVLACVPVARSTRRTVQTEWL